MPAVKKSYLLGIRIMAKTAKVAMVGLGFGAEFIPIYQAHPNAERVRPSAAATRAELNKVGDQFGIEQRYTRYDDVLADADVDFVHINSPIPDHAWMSLRGAGGRQARDVHRADGHHHRRMPPDLSKRSQQTGLKYMMAETVVYSREFLFIKETVRAGRTRQDPVPGRLAPAGHGRLARLLGADDPHALRHARGQPRAWDWSTAWPSTSAASARARCATTSPRSRATASPSSRATSRSRTATSPPTSGGSCTTSPGSTARASTCTARRRASSGR